MYRLITLIACSALLVCAACTHAVARDSSTPTVPSGFTIEPIAHVGGPRELAMAADGDLFVGTNGSTVVVIPNAQGVPGAPHTFVHVDDRPVAGVTIDGDTMYLGAQFGVYALPYHAGDRVARATPHRIAAVRTSGASSDHHTTTVAVAGGVLYASVGSSCNNCQPELDATRATIQQMQRDGARLAPKAVHIRNAIALAVDPQTGALWTGVAGQDELAHGHPYETIDDVSAHSGVADYGWPYCYENAQPVGAGHDCSRVAVARAVVPAYETPVGAVFYPAGGHGRYAFASQYGGALFVALHGSWHSPPVPPRVVWFPMHGDDPQTPVDWNDPTRQWHEFVGGFQEPDGTRRGRPTGIAVGTDGSLFFADDDSDTIYRIRPNRNTVGLRPTAGTLLRAALSTSR